MDYFQSPGQTDSQVNTTFWLVNSTCISFGHPLALTLIKLKFFTSQCKSTQVFHHLATNASQHKLIASQLNNAWNAVQLFATCTNLQADLRIHLATHSKSVCKLWFCKHVLTCISLYVYLARALKVDMWQCRAGLAIHPPTLKIEAISSSLHTSDQFKIFGCQSFNFSCMGTHWSQLRDLSINTSYYNWACSSAVFAWKRGILGHPFEEKVFMYQVF